MNTRHSVALAALALFGCDGDLEKASQLKRFRLFGARVDNLTRSAADPRAAEAAPGETVRVSMRYEDPFGQGRAVQVTWVFCPQVTGSTNPFGCDPTGPGASLMMGREVQYVVPNAMFGIDRNGHASVSAFAFACAGGTTGLVNGRPSCTGEGAESWAMTRTLTVRTDESSAMNHNPEISSVVLYLADQANAPEITLSPDGSTEIPRCASAPCPEYFVEIRTVPGAREVFSQVSASNVPQETTERIQFGYAATVGDFEQGFYVDTPQTPYGPTRIRWTVPSAAGPVKMVLTSLDTRGGFDAVTRDFSVQ